MTTTNHRVTILGLGAMGYALANAQLDRGQHVTVWNRTPDRANALTQRGAIAAADAEEAVNASGLVIVCLHDYASIRETLVPIAAELRGRTVVNLTTTTPNEARELASKAATWEVDYLDGVISAVPPMIGTSEARILYSGPREVLDDHKDVLDVWAVSDFVGADPGLAPLLDLAMLSAMYSMFTGFLHGAAMVQSENLSAAEFAERAAPFLATMTRSFASSAARLDSRDYSNPQQSLDWTATAMDTIVRASKEQGVNPAVPEKVKALVQHEIGVGHGADGFNRIIETMRLKS